MARIGMVGSSHTQGYQPILSKKIKHKDFWHQKNKQFTKFLHEHLSTAMPEHEFFNLGSSGKGTERYLESIVYLKKKYDIEIILVELTQNRKNNTYYKSEEGLFELYKNVYNNPSYRNDLVEELITKQSYYTGSIQSLFNKDIGGVLETIPTKKVKHWKEVCAVQFYQSFEPSVLGVKDIQQSIDLCNMLNIKTVLWSFTEDNLNLDKPNCKKWILENLSKNHYCDNHHASNEAYSKAAYGFFKPMIDAI